MLPGFRPEARLPAHARRAPGLLHDQSTRASDVTPSRRGERGELRGTLVPVPRRRELRTRFTRGVFWRRGFG